MLFSRRLISVCSLNKPKERVTKLNVNTSTRLYEFFKNAHNINDVAKIQPKNLRNTDESRYPLAQLVDTVVKPRGFGDFFIKSSSSHEKKTKGVWFSRADAGIVSWDVST